MADLPKREAIKMDRLDMVNLAANAALAHGLPVALVNAIITVESGWDPWACRYEKDYRWLTSISQRPHNCSGDTEQMAQKTSWGLMQVMGAVARERGMMDWLSLLCDPVVGLEIGCRHLSWQKARHYQEYGWPGVVRAWNTGRGGETPAGLLYQAKVLEALGGEWPA
jgi:soluble lytic murein transglycosylase-like protein